MRSRLVQIARLLHQSGLLAGIDGNLSVRTPNGYLVTRTSCSKALITEQDFVEVDDAGIPLLPDAPRPTSEIGMHLACYAQRPDVQAIVHAHPPEAVARTLVSRGIPGDVLPEAVLITGPVPLVPYATTGSPALATAVGKAVQEADVVLLERHGAVALGRTIEQAFIRMETLEHTARILSAAEAMGTVATLPDSEVARLQALRENFS